MAESLRTIPIIDARDAAQPAAFAARERAAEVAHVLAVARRRYTPAGLALGDAVSRRWLARNASPLGAEIGAVAAVLGRPGAHLLNLSYEWACTCGLRDAGEAAGPQMLRVLDWDLDGLGETLCVIRQRGPAGEWLHIGWPGFAGAITALAPGRFAVAINQPPLPLTRLGAVARGRGAALAGLVVDWAAARPAAWRSRALPPGHLLRQVCDAAPDYATALRLLRETPIAAAAAFTLAGTRRGEAAVIERAGAAHALRPAAPVAAVANHWDGLDHPGAPRWMESHARQQWMAAVLAAGPVAPGFGWLAPPLANPGTRLAAVMRPATGALELVGMNGARRVSAVLTIDRPLA
jgi:hypothetical protein